MGGEFNMRFGWCFGPMGSVWGAYRVLTGSACEAFIYDSGVVEGFEKNILLGTWDVYEDVWIGRRDGQERNFLNIYLTLPFPPSLAGDPSFLSQWWQCYVGQTPDLHVCTALLGTVGDGHKAGIIAPLLQNLWEVIGTAWLTCRPVAEGQALIGWWSTEQGPAGCWSASRTFSLTAMWNPLPWAACLLLTERYTSYHWGQEPLPLWTPDVNLGPKRNPWCYLPYFQNFLAIFFPRCLL